MSPTQQLHDLRQSLWLDNITRGLLTSGTLRHYIDDLSVTGLTSNPSIFDLAIKNSHFYDDAIRQKRKQGKSGEALFCELAEQSGLRQHIDAMFAGDKISVIEQRSVLHVALRPPNGGRIFADGADVVPEVHAVLDKMAKFAEQIRSGAWKGHTGQSIRNVMNIGIGGSDLGPVMAYEALKYYSQRDVTVN